MRYLYRFVGTRRLARAQEHLEAVLQAWSSAWRIDHETAPLRVHLLAADRDLHGFIPANDGVVLDAPHEHDAGSVMRLDHVRGAIFLRASADDWRTFVFGYARDELPADALADSVLAQARQSLIGSLAEGAVHSTTGHERKPTAHLAKSIEDGPLPGLAWIHVDVHHGESPHAVMSLLLDARRFDDALAPKPPAVLIPRQQAIANATLRLRLQFALTDVSAADLQHLQPGAVVQSNHRLDEPLYLGTEAQPQLLTAFLGQRDGHLAARIAVKATVVTATASGNVPGRQNAASAINVAASRTETSNHPSPNTSIPTIVAERV